MPKNDDRFANNFVDELKNVLTVVLAVIGSLRASRMAMSAEVGGVNVIIRHERGDDLDEFLPTLGDAMKEEQSAKDEEQPREERGNEPQETSAV